METVPAYIHTDIYSSPSFMVITAALKVNGVSSGSLVCVLNSHPTPTLVVMYSKCENLLLEGVSLERMHCFMHWSQLIFMARLSGPRYVPSYVHTYIL